MKPKQFLKIFIAFCVFFKYSNAIELPPLPEKWILAINDILTGIKTDEFWLDNYLFLAPPRVKPNYVWNALVEATWTGPSLVDTSLLEYIQLEFDPLNREFNSSWSGDKVMVVSSYDKNTKKIKFAPRSNTTFMIAPASKLGVYTHMYFSLKIRDIKIPSMYVSINTRALRDVEVTCSDGLFCNGEERLVRGKCIKSKSLPCEDPAQNPCSSYECIESEKKCKSTPLGGNQCPSCKNGTSLQLNSTAQCRSLGLECGWNDRRTLFCGLCTSSDQICSKNKCISKNALGEGSCSNPHQLYAPSFRIPDQGVQPFTVFGDLRLPNYTDHVMPRCNPAPVVDVVYAFQIASPHPMGMEVQMMKADGTNDIMDTVLALTDENCEPLAIYSFCGDDNTPPGSYSSRVFGYLNNGTYKLIASAYSSVPANIDEYMLKVKFYPNCVPQCDGDRKCGNDGCGGNCGICESGLQCDINSGQCRANPCVPQCSFVDKNNNVTVLKKCGDNGCGGVCGSCDLKNSEMCETQNGQCTKVVLCNSKIPQCLGEPPASMENPYCAHDCKWHDMKEDLSDLSPNDRELMQPTIEFDWRTVANRSCAVVEGCLRFEGERFLLRFHTYVHNVGRIDFRPTPPTETPNQFQWSPCHSHFHFEGFASFNLYDMDSKLVVYGGKRGYCAEDSIQTWFGEQIPCKNLYDCSNQGIQPGWADLYPNVLDCQWLDITDIPTERWYIYEICSNVERLIPEAAHSNDCKRFPVYIPKYDKKDGFRILKYDTVLRSYNLTTLPNVKQEPGIELDLNYENPSSISLSKATKANSFEMLSLLYLSIFYSIFYFLY